MYSNSIALVSIGEPLEGKNEMIGFWRLTEYLISIVARPTIFLTSIRYVRLHGEFRRESEPGSSGVATLSGIFPRQRKRHQANRCIIIAKHAEFGKRSFSRNQIRSVFRCAKWKSSLA
jgi:hypothetical protein